MYIHTGTDTNPSGDVHLAAMGQFYSNPKLGVPKDKDYRYMPNIIASGVANNPETEMVSDMLNRRNQVHHMDSNTDEDMIPIFTHDVDGRMRNNKRLLPRRNWCSIREYQPGKLSMYIYIYIYFTIVLTIQAQHHPIPKTKTKTKKKRLAPASFNAPYLSHAETDHHREEAYSADCRDEAHHRLATSTWPLARPTTTTTTALVLVLVHVA